MDLTGRVGYQHSRSCTAHYRSGPGTTPWAPAVSQVLPDHAYAPDAATIRQLEEPDRPASHPQRTARAATPPRARLRDQRRSCPLLVAGEREQPPLLGNRHAQTQHNREQRQSTVAQSRPTVAAWRPDREGWLVSDPGMARSVSGQRPRARREPARTGRGPSPARCGQSRRKYP